MKLKQLYIILFVGIILAFKACIIIHCCQIFYLNEIISSQSKYRNFNYTIYKDFSDEPNIQNLPGIKVEPIQIRFVNEHRIVFLIRPNFANFFSIKYIHLPDKYFQFTQRNLQHTYLTNGVLLI